MSVQIHFDLETITDKEVQGLRAMLAVLGGEQEVRLETRTAVEVVTDKEEISRQMADTVEEPKQEPVAEEPKRRGRKPKDKSLDELNYEAGIDRGLAQAAQEKPKAESQATSGGPTQEELQTALESYYDKFGLEKTGELLADFGCKRLSELTGKAVTEQQDFLKCIRKAVAEASNA